jgi:SAM-dependent methyltransferase
MRDITSDYWINRHRSQGRNYVSRRGADNYEEQRTIITDAVRSHLTCVDGGKYDRTLDFGCGVGRFQELLWEFSEEIDALDWVDAVLEEVKTNNPRTNVICYRDLPLPLEEGRYQLVWACMVLQHIVNPTRFRETCRQLGAAAVPGAKFVLIENASDVAPHVALRPPETYAASLGFSVNYVEPLAIDKPGSHWLIVGNKEE